MPLIAGITTCSDFRMGISVPSMIDDFILYLSGHLNHPVACLCRAIIRFYGTDFTTARNHVLMRVLVESE